MPPRERPPKTLSLQTQGTSHRGCQRHLQPPLCSARCAPLPPLPLPAPGSRPAPLPRPPGETHHFEPGTPGESLPPSAPRAPSCPRVFPLPFYLPDYDFCYGKECVLKSFCLTEEWAAAAPRGLGRGSPPSHSSPRARSVCDALEEGMAFWRKGKEDRASRSATEQRWSPEFRKWDQIYFRTSWSAEHPATSKARLLGSRMSDSSVVRPQR